MTANKLYYAGLDLGSTMTKVVITDDTDAIIARVETHTGAEHRRLANKVMEQALAQASLALTQLEYIVATGYGRINVPFADRQLTELSCHARGLSAFFPTARTGLDIGGQDAKGLRLDDKGRLVNFVMNDRCAAGTGRYLEVVAETLGLKLDDMGPVSLSAKNKATISSTCTIFAQTEMIARLSEGVPIEEIVAGLHEAIASRTVNMLRRVGIKPDVVFTGGVARNTGVVAAVQEKLGMELLVPEDPLISGALGAAILGRELSEKAQAKGDTLAKAERKLKEATFFHGEQ
ncbi:acyl-CoA dehydratase activase [Chloroflexota bacterium]